MDKITEKLFPIIRYISEKLTKNHDLAFDFNKLDLGVYEIDSILREINFCLILDLHQASITLTNHLLEKSLKLLLIYDEGGKQQVTDLSKINELYGEFSKKFNGKDLNDTINLACTKGLINKEEKKVLHIYRDRLRNGFSHSDMDKIFKDIRIPLVMGSFNNPGKLQNGEAKLSEVPFLQGVAQEKLAEDSALNYYRFVYNIIKRKIDVIK